MRRCTCSAMGLLRSAACRRSISGVTPFCGLSKNSIDGALATVGGSSLMCGGGLGGLAAAGGLATCGGVAVRGVLGGGLAGRGAGRETICCTCAEIDLGPDEKGMTADAGAVTVGLAGGSGAAALLAGAALRTGAGGEVFAGDGPGIFEGGAARATGAAAGVIAAWA